MENGWIKLHRKILDNPIATKSTWAWLWVVILLKANHEQKEFFFNGALVECKAGQLLTGRQQLAIDSGLSESAVERALKYFEKIQQIEQQKTTKYRLITILKWKDYQQADSKRTTNEQQMNTNKKYKKYNKEIPDEANASLIAEVVKLFEGINPACKKMYGNTTQRKACDNIINTFSFERAKTIIEKTLPKTNKLAYFPTIETPLQLWQKWTALESAVHKHQEKKEGDTKKIIGL